MTNTSGSCFSAGDSRAQATRDKPGGVKCQECGKALGDEPFTVTVGVLNTNTQFRRSIQAPVCDEECAKKYMLRVKGVLVMTNLRVGEGG